MMSILKNRSADTILASRLRLCRSYFSRLLGLMGTPRLDPDEACWIIPCNSVHTLGMKYPLDLYFLDKKNQVVAILENMKPNRFSPVFWKAHSVVEFSGGISRSCKIGDQLAAEEDP